MNIQKINVEYAVKSGFYSHHSDGIRHTKILPYLSVVQAVEGHYDIRLGDGALCNTGCGGFFIAPAYMQQTITHHADGDSGAMRCRWVFLKIKINDVYMLDELYEFPTVIPQPYQSRMNDIFDKLFDGDDAFDEYVCYYEIVRLLSAIAKEKICRKPSFLDNAILYIKEHYGEKITVEAIAADCNVSASYLFAAFQKHIGISPISYLNRYRLSVAAEQLKDTDKTVGEIAVSVGVSDAIYFNKMFKKQYQTSPTEYRKMNITKAE